MNLIFIHHSVGGQLLASPGPTEDIADSIHESHINGGALRSLLTADGYRVHEASYGSIVGDRTDIFDWPAKFRDHFDRILDTKLNDAVLEPGVRNDIVVFKSCYPNNRFVGRGTDLGNPSGPDLTLSNAQAALRSLLPICEQHKSTLFVYVTAPPNAARFPREPLAKVALQRLLGKPTAAEVLARRAQLAREFNTWVVSTSGWLETYREKNVVVFDYYDILTDGPTSDFSRFPSGDGSDSHPVRAGQEKAARKFVPFLNRAVQRFAESGSPKP